MPLAFQRPRRLRQQRRPGAGTGAGAGAWRWLRRGAEGNASGAAVEAGMVMGRGMIPEK